MSKRTIFFAWALLFSSVSGAGAFKDEVDRFTDNRSVSWMAMPSQPKDFSFSVFAFYPKGYTTPYLYRIQLLTRSDQWQYLDCHHTDWLVDGKRDPYLEMKYENSMAGSSTLESFSKRVDRANIERLASSKLIEFKVCGTEGRVSEQDMAGLRRVVDATK
jgi:hypothetical protein